MYMTTYEKTTNDKFNSSELLYHQKYLKQLTSVDNMKAFNTFLFYLYYIIIIIVIYIIIYQFDFNRYIATIIALLLLYPFIIYPIQIILYGISQQIKKITFGVTN
jgi:hypothetical protein